ncbi:STAS domain-containing protein [Streptomyces lavendulae]|uniref:STAS domain-containing protein n=1 Tax=Streptomyces lavendulae TaxID=1914 RepID=UPI003717DE5B
MISTELQRRGSTLFIGLNGDLDVAGGPGCIRWLDQMVPGDRTLLIDLHGIVFMDPAGLSLLLDAYRRAEWLGLKVLVVGWQAQPRRLLAHIAGMLDPRPATGGSLAASVFHRLLGEPTGRDGRARTVNGPASRSFRHQ